MNEFMTTFLVMFIALSVVFGAFISISIQNQRIYRKTLEEFKWDPAMTGVEFEHHCCDYLRLKGWKASMTSGSGDQGIDIIAKKDGIKVVLQCKKYSKSVGNKAVQEVLAGKHFSGAKVAAVVSNQTYTPSAQELAYATDVHLLHFTDLANADRIFLHNKFGLSADEITAAGENEVLTEATSEAQQAPNLTKQLSKDQ